MKLRILMILSSLLILACAFGITAAEEADFTDVVVLSTTDMHGKCWNTNLLTGAPVKNSMLSVSTAVRGERETYGDEHVILIDNGDLFQGTPVSEAQLAAFGAGESGDMPAMALCLKEIGYDAFVLGNHEFNYAWNVMSPVYRWLEENGVAVLAANVVWDGTDGVHEAGANAFTPWTVRTLEVNGHEHRIGILGLENCDVSRWDLPARYPGLKFVHPGNDSYSMAAEAEMYLADMRKNGCEFIIVAYHGGLGEDKRPLVFGDNTQHQGLRMIRETEGIDLLILGHDHSPGYSNTSYPGKDGREVPVVNAGGQEMTRTVIRFSEDASGALRWEIGDSCNLNLAGFEPDPALQQKMEPYAALASELVERPIGTAGGEWDESAEYFTRQTDTIDLSHAACIEMASRALKHAYPDPASAGVEGLDHLEVDMSVSSNLTSGGYVIRPGDMSMRDIYRLYRFANHLLVIPMRGSQIRAVMEENAASRLTARVLDGEAYFYNTNDDSTHLLFGGVSFTYDMSAPEGQRVQIDGFASGQPFEENRVYLTAVSDYLLGNEMCGMRAFSADDAVWAQDEDDLVQDLIAAYVRETCERNGSLTPDLFTWHWSLEYSADPASVPPYDGDAAARLVPEPEDGHTYVLLHEPSQMTMGSLSADGAFGSVHCPAQGEVLTAPLDPEVQRFTVRFQDGGSMALVNADGLYLTSGARGGMSLEKEMVEGGLSQWTLRKAYGGWNIICAGSDVSGYTPLGLEFYHDHITTYAVSASGVYIFNFYEIEHE